MLSVVVIIIVQVVRMVIILKMVNVRNQEKGVLHIPKVKIVQMQDVVGSKGLVIEYNK